MIIYNHSTEEIIGELKRRLVDERRRHMYKIADLEAELTMLPPDEDEVINYEFGIENLWS